MIGFFKLETFFPLSFSGLHSLFCGTIQTIWQFLSLNSQSHKREKTYNVQIEFWPEEIRMRIF